MGKRHFGSLRKRSSDDGKPSYWHDGRLHSAPQMFTTKSDARPVSIQTRPAA